MPIFIENSTRRRIKSNKSNFMHKIASHNEFRKKNIQTRFNSELELHKHELPRKISNLYFNRIHVCCLSTLHLNFYISLKNKKKVPAIWICRISLSITILQYVEQLLAFFSYLMPLCTVQKAFKINWKIYITKFNESFNNKMEFLQSPLFDLSFMKIKKEWNKIKVWFPISIHSILIRKKSFWLTSSMFVSRCLSYCWKWMENHHQHYSLQGRVL
jgi:hypothetical protein